MNDNLFSYAKTIIANGPRRVLVEDDRGEFGVTPKCAREDYDIEPDIIFIRKDGWSLGAPDHLADKAEHLWTGSWIGVLIRPNTEPITMAEYEKIRGER